MSPNRTSSQLTGTAPSSPDQGFARRRINDLAGLAAILSTTFVVALITGTDTPAFAVALFAAIGALAYVEQRVRDVADGTSSAGVMAGRHARA